MRVKMGALLAVAVTLLVPATAEACPQSTITGQFGDACRDFTTHSSKDISHVVLQYVDGRTVKDERIDRRYFSVDGHPGDELASVVVKSGRTVKSFGCERQVAPPVAALEIFTPPIGADDGSESCAISAGEEAQRLSCSYDAERTTWTRWETPGLMLWTICPGVANEHCSAYPFNEIPWTFDLRASSSTDPDGDITQWAIDFGDGTSASGSWAADPPVGLSHTYLTRDFDTDTGFVTITLTVTDAAGHTDTDSLTVGLQLANDV